MRRLALVALAAAALAWGGATVFRDDDRPVDPNAPESRRAAAAALEVVPGRVRGVARDEDNGKWEVTILQQGREYEVELHPQQLTLLRVDYD
jgi:uncharacterized membrane protein YkoI